MTYRVGGGDTSPVPEGPAGGLSLMSSMLSMQVYRSGTLEMIHYKICIDLEIHRHNRFPIHPLLSFDHSRQLVAHFAHRTTC